MDLKYPREILCFVLLLLFFNLSAPTDSSAFYLFPGALFNGEFTRWLSFAWKHNSFYHLVLDASAFIFLYQTLRCGLNARLLHLFSCIFFSGLIPLLIDPRLGEIGLCGLSGVAHGLTLICALEMAENSTGASQRVAVLIFAGVLGKTILEQITGTVLFAEHHLGNVGIPIASCHFGGALGGILSSVFLWEKTKWPSLKTRFANT